MSRKRAITDDLLTSIDRRILLLQHWCRQNGRIRPQPLAEPEAEAVWAAWDEHLAAVRTDLARLLEPEDDA